MIREIVVWAELPCVDRTLFTDQLLTPGSKIVVPSAATLGGGVGGNFAAACRLHGVATTAVGLASEGPLARVDYDDLLARGVQLIEVRSRNGSVDPIVCTLVVPEGTDRTILIEYPDVPAADYEALRHAFVEVVRCAEERGPVGVYLGVLRPHPALALMEVATKPAFVGCTLETSDWPDHETQGCLARIDLVFVAEETYADHRDEVDEWQTRFGFDLIVTLGPKGALLHERGGLIQQFAAHPPSGGVRDTSGAGDCFAATYCSHAWAGASRSEAMSLAAVVAGTHTAWVGARVHPQLLDQIVEERPNQ